MNESESGWAGTMIQWMLIYILATSLLLGLDWVFGGVIPAWAYNIANPLMWIDSKIGIVEWLQLDGIAAWIGRAGPAVADVVGVGPLYALVAFVTLMILTCIAGVGARWCPTSLLIGVLLASSLGQTREAIMERRAERAAKRGDPTVADRYLAKLSDAPADRAVLGIPASNSAQLKGIIEEFGESIAARVEARNERVRKQLLDEVDDIQRGFGPGTSQFDIQDLATARAYLGDVEGARELLDRIPDVWKRDELRGIIAITEGERGNLAQASEDRAAASKHVSGRFAAIGVVLAHAKMGQAMLAIEEAAAIKSLGRRETVLMVASIFAAENGHPDCGTKLLDAIEVDCGNDPARLLAIAAAWRTLGDEPRAQSAIARLRELCANRSFDDLCSLAIAEQRFGNPQRCSDLLLQAEGLARKGDAGDGTHRPIPEMLGQVATAWRDAGVLGPSRRIAKELEGLADRSRDPLDREMTLTYSAYVHALNADMSSALRLGRVLSEGPDKRVLAEIAKIRAREGDINGAKRVVKLLPASHRASMLREFAYQHWHEQLFGRLAAAEQGSRRGRRANRRLARHARPARKPAGVPGATTGIATRIALLGWLGSALVASADTRFVDLRAVGAGTGVTWQDAYPSLQDALAAARSPGSSIHELRIAEGTYRPDHGGGHAAGDQLASFELVDGVAIRGGYRGLGGGGSPDDRDIIAFGTILSGDLKGDDGPAFQNYTDNSARVVLAVSVGPATSLDGVTIRGGYGLIIPSSPGSGLRLVGADLAMIECTILHNLGAAACGMMSIDGSPTLTRCRFIENSGPAGSGAVGAGLYATDGVLTLKECTFIGNKGLMITAKGAGLYRLRGITLIDRCTFIGNTVQATQGGAMYLNESNSLVTSSLFVGNKASDLGGAICVYKGAATIAGCSIVSNGLGTIVNGSNGGVLVHGGGSLTIANSILWDNRPSFGGPTQASNLSKGSTSTLVVHHSCIQGWTGSFGGTGNHGKDPKFLHLLGPDGLAGTGDEDLRLLPGSPCIDSGSNFLMPAGSLWDLLGVRRFVDEPLTPNTGIGSGAIVDMGAHESSFHADLD